MLAANAHGFKTSIEQFLFNNIIACKAAETASDGSNNTVKYKKTFNYSRE